MTLLAVRHVAKKFGGLIALADIEFEVEKGEILGLMGANGAGKTTLFSLIAGHLKPDGGAIEFESKPITGMRPDSICRRGIARTFQIVRPFSNMTVLENVETALMFGGRIRSNSKGDETSYALRILEEVGLDQLAHEQAGSLTLSARKRLEVARALGTEPVLLLLDEVMAGLIPSEVADMIAIVRRIKEKRNLTIVLVEHVVQALMELSDRIIVMHNGRIIVSATPDAVARHPEVRAVYFGEVEE